MIPENSRTKIARIDLMPSDQPHLVLSALRAASRPVTSVRSYGALCYAVLEDGMTKSDRAIARRTILDVIVPGTYSSAPEPSMESRLDGALKRLDSLEARP